MVTQNFGKDGVGFVAGGEKQVKALDVFMMSF